MQFLHFSPTCFETLSWNFAYDFVLMYYRSSSSVFSLHLSGSPSVRLSIFVPCFRESAGTLNLIRLSVCPSVCHKNFNLGHNFCTTCITGRALILSMCVLCDKTFPMVPCHDLDRDLWPTSRSNLLPSKGPQIFEFAYLHCLLHLYALTIELKFLTWLLTIELKFLIWLSICFLNVFLLEKYYIKTAF